MKRSFDPVFFESNGLVLRLIGPQERDVIEQAVRINNKVWGKRMSATFEEFSSRVEHGYVIGAFDADGLAGTISGLGGSTAELAKSSYEWAHPYRTWDGITDFGTFKNADPNPDILFCVAVTTRSGGQRPYPDVPEGKSELLEIARGMAAEKDASSWELSILYKSIAANVDSYYCRTDMDYVLRFHMRDKDRLPGAKLVSIRQKGRLADLGSMGYNVIMQYPQVPDPKDFPCDFNFNSIGEALILAAACLASRHSTLKWVMPYSRPAQFRHNLILALIAGAGFPVPRSGPVFDRFVDMVKRAVNEMSF